MLRSSSVAIKIQIRYIWVFIACYHKIGLLSYVVFVA